MNDSSPLVPTVPLTGDPAPPVVRIRPPQSQPRAGDTDIPAAAPVRVSRTASGGPAALAAIAISIAWIVAWYWTTGAAMVSIWARSETFAHGFVVVPIAAWLIWRRRHQLSQLAPSPAWWVLVPLAACGFGWLLGQLGAVNAVSQLALMSMIVLAVPAVLGIPAARTIAFPLGFLFFAVPIGEFVMPRLMEWTADFTVLALRLSGVPVYREGLQFIIPSGAWSVVEACSGIRYLIASLVVGTLYAYLSYVSLRRRLLFIAVAIIVPIVANWLRAYMIVMIGHLSGNKFAVGVDHLVYGWVFFGLVMMLMFWIGARWRDDNPQAAAEIAGTPAAPTPIDETARVALGKQWQAVWLAAFAVFAVTAAWPLTYRLIDRIDAGPAPALRPPDIPGWQPLATDPLGWRPAYQSPSAEYSRVYRRGDQQVGLFVAYYRNQAHTQKLVSSDNVLVKSLDPHWTQLSHGRRQAAIAGQSIAVATADLRGSTGERLEARYWYWINGRLTANDYLAKGYTALAQLQGRGDDSAVVVVYTFKDTPEGSAGTLDDFIAGNASAVVAALRQARAQR